MMDIVTLDLARAVLLDSATCCEIRAADHVCDTTCPTLAQVRLRHPVVPRPRWYRVATWRDGRTVLRSDYYDGPDGRRQCYVLSCGQAAE